MCNKDFEKRLEIAIQKIGGVGLACAKAGITYPTLTRWKEGTSDPKLSNIVAFAKAANVSLDWLVNGLDGNTGEVNTEIPDIAAISAAKGISVEDAIDTLKAMIDTQHKLTEEERFLLSEFRVLDDDQRRMMLRFIIGGFDSLNSGGDKKGIFGSPHAKIEDSFKG
ncbi:MULTISPECIES: helix-turn-helix domain-containing protein [unclassified Psychrobacter]|jgi:transcriptional regulator with XRE-family HTH domain|uniref:helix-turn-helix domain-containing protein n=1 Tax=unclassified Psychrobacter TaxID=196806 RepID=UPI003FD1C5A3